MSTMTSVEPRITGAGGPPLGAPTAALPEHLIELPDSPGWALWRCVALRGAGFPASTVLELSSAAGSAAADRLIAAEERSEAARNNALRLANQALDDLRANGRWDDPDARKPLLKVARALDKGKKPKAIPDPRLGAAIAAWDGAAEALEEAWERYRRTLERSLEELSEHLARVAGEPRFREAVLWQNRHAYHTALRKLSEDPSAERRSQKRQHEELVASYLQRYGVKNDTIGFFGPVGWAQFVDTPGALAVQPGEQLLARRTVYLESWCIDALARCFAERRGVRRFIAPRRLPSIRLDASVLHVPGQAPARLPPVQAALLAACDGERTAARIAADLVADPALGLRSERQVLLLLERLRALDLIEWSLRIPVQPFAERTLRRLLERIDDPALRGEGLAALGELEAAAAEVGRAAGDPDRLDRALAALEALFTRLTDTAATRSAGRTYAARTLIYEDCRRDIEVRIGADLRRVLAPPLDLVLASVRWYTFEIAARYRVAFGDLYRELAREAASPVVDAHRFWNRVQPLFFEGDKRIMDGAIAGCQERWCEALGLNPEALAARRLAFTAARLRPRIGELFAAPRPGWQMARYHNPDVMVVAPDTASLARDAYQLVLGEIHVGVNTLNGWVFMAQHPNIDEVARHLEIDLPEPRVVPLAPEHWPTLTTRTQVAIFSAKDYYLASTANAAGPPGTRALPISALVVEKEGDRLQIRTRDGRLCFDAIEFFGELLSFMANDGFHMLPRASHLPRITIDRLVLARETWSVEAARLGFAGVKDTAGRFLAARRWARDRGLPRFVFVKAAVEKKPFYVDFESPIYVDLFAKVIRRTLDSDRAGSPITISEMLPTPEELWLHDTAGRPYTNELRILALDRT